MLDTANLILSLLVVFAQLFIVVLLLALIFRNKINHGLFQYLGKEAILFSFLIALIATLGSLFYSEVAHFTPCSLCWYQRIMMYPQVLILGLALWKKESIILDYSLVLTIVGFVISGYHNYVYYTATTTGFCGLQSCVQKYIAGFGYVSIPVMALTGFLLIGLLLFSKKVSARV